MAISPQPQAGAHVPLFPIASKTTLVRNKKLNDAVIAAVNNVATAASGPPPPFAITIVDPANLAMGGFNDDKEHYVASLVKVAVLYAAYALRDMLRRYITLRSPGSADALFKAVRADKDTEIERSSNLVFGGVSHKYRVPHYENVFSVTSLGGRLQVDFTTGYKHALREMIIPSNNDSAARCIHGIGYGYINGALERGGFFDSAAKSGVWVGGDFSKGWPYVRIPCVNDIDTAQGATSLAMARLMAVMMFDSAIPDDFQMVDLLKHAAHEGDSSFLLRSEVANHLRSDQVTHAKIGYGPLKDHNIPVYSEICLVKGIGRPNKPYIVEYQNIDYRPYSLTDVITVLKAAIIAYE